MCGCWCTHTSTLTAQPSNAKLSNPPGNLCVACMQCLLAGSCVYSSLFRQRCVLAIESQMPRVSHKCFKFQQLAAQLQPQQHQNNSTHGEVAVAVAHLKTGRWLGTYFVVSFCGKILGCGAMVTNSVGWCMSVRRYVRYGIQRPPCLSGLPQPRRGQSRR